MAAKAKPVQALMYLRPDQFKALNELSARTRIQRSVLVREAIDDLLKKYRRRVR
jgi:metal-responsive CopG/Arc/MetJ family transcriptional regulator